MQYRFQRLDGFAAGLRRVERRAAARVRNTQTLGEASVGRHLPKPIGLCVDRSARRVSGHTRVYTILRVAAFPFVHREVARFSDLDPMGHANNAVYLTWIENARIEFLRRLGAFDKPDTTEMAMILARVELDFRAPVGFGDEIEIGVRTARLGTKSFDLAYELRCGETIVANATTVLVAYDYETNSSKEIPDEWRRRLAA
jgi:acyl-CoA thioester hydrolase